MFIKNIADGSGVLVVSVGYRLAPENPFPAGNEDSYDVAEWLVDHGEKKFGAPLKFIGGDASRNSPTCAEYSLTSHQVCRRSFEHA